MSHVWTVAPVALVTLAALVPPRRPRSGAQPWVSGSATSSTSSRSSPSAGWWCRPLIALGNESLGSPAGLAVLALAVLTACGLALITWRGLLAGPVVARALRRDLGLGGTAGLSVGSAGGPAFAGADGVLALAAPTARRAADRECQLRPCRAAQSTRSVSPPVASRRRACADPLSRRALPDGRQESRSTGPVLPARKPGLGVYQRGLSARQGRAASRHRRSMPNR